VSDEPDERQTQWMVLQAMHAVLSDDHNYERGLAALNDLVEQGLLSEDLVDVWFAE
jgi:hypothetical protein